MKPGFMLIELIVASLVASMVAVLLLAALSQSNRFQMIDDNMIDISTRVAVISNQLEKDVMGAFIPVQSEEKKEEAKKSSVPEASKDKSSEKQEEQKAPAKESPKPIEKIFYSANKNGQLDALTFVTNNPLVVYVGKDVGVVKPKVVRVQYSLKPEADKKDSYALFRQESMELDLENYKNVTAYEVIGGIKRCTVTFTAKIKKSSSDSAKATSDKSAPAPEKVQYEYKTQNEWVSEQKKESSSAKATEDKPEFPRIPFSIEMKLILWDLQDKKEKEFTIVCEIPTDFSPIKKHDKDKKEPSSAEATEGRPEEGIPSATRVASNNKQTTREIIRVVDRRGNIIYEAEKNENTMNEIQKMFGRA
jgi:type II secretory pathway component PulJ